jgi:hypothetical protein
MLRDELVCSPPHKAMCLIDKQNGTYATLPDYSLLHSLTSNVQVTTENILVSVQFAEIMWVCKREDFFKDLSKYQQILNCHNFSI